LLFKGVARELLFCLSQGMYPQVNVPDKNAS